MLGVSLLMQPWTALARATFQSAIPRVLADDMALTMGATREMTDDELIDEVALGIELTDDYINDAGSKLSHDKCIVITNSKRAKTYFK
eukprot:1146490-Alexandrium_andersonii.AAC.1